MTDIVHPTLDKVADLRERLLEPHQAAAVEAHLSVCADCAALLAALDDVSVQLADVGADLAVMPASVAADLDATLDRASAEREAGVPSLADRRTSDSLQPYRTPSRRPAWILIGAAAAVAVIAIPIGLNNREPGSDLASDSAGSVEELGQRNLDEQGPRGAQEGSAGGAEGRTDPTGPASSLPTEEARRVERLNPRNLAAFAARADSAQDTEVSEAPLAIAARCATYKSLTSADDKRAIAAPARWRGKRAVVLVDLAASSVSVFDCRTPTEVLYSTNY